MSKWTLEPGHTAAEFCVRHMMVTFVRGAFKNVEGSVEFDPHQPQGLAAEIRIRAANLWSGDADRDAHLKNTDFLDVENHPEITFKSRGVEVLGKNDFTLTGDLTLRGVSRPVDLQVRFLGTWETPWWEGGEDQGPKTRAGFVATTEINRHDFGVSWTGEISDGGRVVGDMVEITLDAEAIFES